MTSENKEGRKMAIIAYLTILGALIALSMNENKNAFASFHIRQSFGLSLTFFALGFLITAFDNMGVTLGFWIFFFVLWLFGFLGALQGKFQEVPISGKFFQKLFKTM